MFLLLYCKYKNFIFKVKSHNFLSVDLSVYVPQHHISLNIFKKWKYGNNFYLFILPSDRRKNRLLDIKVNKDY